MVNVEFTNKGSEIISFSYVDKLGGTYGPNPVEPNQKTFRTFGPGDVVNFTITKGVTRKTDSKVFTQDIQIDVNTYFI